MPIISGTTDDDNTDGNTYILVFREYLFYGSQINLSLIKHNQIRLNSLDFYDNPARDEEFYVELNDDLNIPLQFKGTKCTFLLRVTTLRELETCQNFDMTSDNKWDPESIDLNNICKISQYRRLKRYVLRVQRDTLYLLTLSDLFGGIYAYQYTRSDESILSETNPSRVQLKELCIAQIKIQGHGNKHFTARHNFVYQKRHSNLTAESLS